VRQGDSARWVRAEQVRGLFQPSTPAPSSSPGATPPLPESGALVNEESEKPERVSSPSTERIAGNSLSHRIGGTPLDDASVNDTSADRPNSSPIAAIVGVLLNLYVISVMIAIPYFNFRYANKHGFVNWLLLGEIVPTAQAVVWPNFAFTGRSTPSLTDQEKDNLEHYHRSSDAVRQAQRILNAGPPDQISQLKPEEAVAYISLYKIALNEAKQVDLDVLAKIHPELPQHYRDEYLPAVELLHQSHTSVGTFNNQMESHRLWDDWVDWFNANKSDIRMPKRER
jgi:hypothetical protein